MGTFNPTMTIKSKNITISSGCGGSEPCGNPNCNTSHPARCSVCRTNFKNNAGLRIHLAKVAAGTVVHHTEEVMESVRFKYPKGFVVLSGDEVSVTLSIDTAGGKRMTGNVKVNSVIHKGINVTKKRLKGQF